MPIGGPKIRKQWTSLQRRPFAQTAGRQFVCQQKPSTSELSMNSTKIASIGLAASLAAVLPAIPAQATSLTRTFVSSAGSDSNPCSITQPCATFARAYSLTTASGIIAALDPGKYGPVTITGPVTINGYGWAAITGPASGNAITINANSSDKISLIGLEIDGANAVNSIGIELNSGGSLTVRDSAIQNFTRYGILFQPNASDLPLNFHPAAIRASAVDTPFGAV
jgi:hypothetical protein